ncbi:MAG: helix-turn-helix transcriptional regulator [Nannocystis sp.]|nr:helix-turn-helix transcriptional regulator [Nannocystis sp.]
MNEEQSKSKKFRQSRELVRIARDAGMTQDDIAKRCRTTQSTVSNWLNGKTKGTEQQLKPLLDLFGSRLRRETSRTYLLTPKSSDRGVDMQVVQGRIVLRHVFVTPKLRSDTPAECVEDFAKKRPMRILQFVATSRWILHEVAGSQFVLVRQTRRVWSEGTEQVWSLRIDTFGRTIYDSRVMGELQRDPWLRCADDSARWYSVIHEPQSVSTLLNFVDAYKFETEDDSLTARFLVRKALHEHGHTVPGLAKPNEPE